MELWDIYDENKQPTGRTMKRNDWHMKLDEFHLTVLGVIARPDGTPRKLLDVSKLESLGYHYTTELEDGIRLTYEDFLNNPMRAER